VVNGDTIKTLAQYIASLHQRGATLEKPEDYVQDNADTNGTEKDHDETPRPTQSDY